MVDRAGFEPAAFRFFFAWMRTGRSLAPELVRAYQAELPALECHKTYSNINGLPDLLISLNTIAQWRMAYPPSIRLGGQCKHTSCGPAPQIVHTAQSLP